jgi:hypothetical protein
MYSTCFKRRNRNHREDRAAAENFSYQIATTAANTLSDSQTFQQPPYPPYDYDCVSSQNESRKEKSFRYAFLAIL